MFSEIDKLEMIRNNVELAQLFLKSCAEENWCVKEYGSCTAALNRIDS